MEPGSGVRHCANYFARDGGGPIAAGGVVVYGSSSGASATAYLNGGEITDCVGPDLGAGGMYVGNGAHVYVKGVAVTGNKSHSGAASNLVVQDKSSLVLAGRQAAKIGFTEGYKADTNVFGTVAKRVYVQPSTPGARTSLHLPSPVFSIAVNVNSSQGITVFSPDMSSTAISTCP